MESGRDGIRRGKAEGVPQLTPEGAEIGSIEIEIV